LYISPGQQGHCFWFFFKKDQYGFNEFNRILVV
jgi:hypothetical protein